MALSVGDLFCGAGGFSEGFRQAGFKVRWAVDNSEPAVATFRKNHPRVKWLNRDIMELRADELEPVDVVVGSPPCTHFSLANRGGNGDKIAGFRLVKRFFELVQDLEPKYWIMENVPSLATTLEAALKDDVISLNRGRLQIPARKTLVAADYGTPQIRKRLFSGDYPMPSPVSGEEELSWPTLEQALKDLPDPCSGPEKSGKWVHDPLYPGVKIPLPSLRDHFEDTDCNLNPDDLERCESQKREHWVYGPMDWPDRLDRPSRTITATRTKRSRSTIVIECPHHDGQVYRTLTLRESASVQGFPIVYQFWADSMPKKSQLIGNAVPPPMARALAHAILREEGKPIPATPVVHQSVRLPEPIEPPKGRRYRYPIRRRFRCYVRVDWTPSCRVELDNIGGRLGKGPSTDRPAPRGWVARLYLGYAKDYRCYEVPHDRAIRMADEVSDGWKSLYSLKPYFSKLLLDAKTAFDGWLPGSAALQQRWAGRTTGGIGPEEVLSKVKEIVERNFPKKAWGEATVPRHIYSSILSRLLVEQGTDADAQPPSDLPVRTLAALLVLSLACDLTAAA